jgi:hypothetical protein
MFFLVSLSPVTWTWMLIRFRSLLVSSRPFVVLDEGIGIGLVAMASFGGAADAQAQRRRAALPELRACCVAARFVVH